MRRLSSIFVEEIRDLVLLVEPLLGKIFGRAEVMMVTGYSAATGTKYISMLEGGGLIELAVGMGKGKYRFKAGD